MPNVHATKPKAVRMPGGLQAWYEEFAAAEGKPVNAVLVAALEEFRARHDRGGSTTPVAPPRARPVSARTAPAARFVAADQEQPQVPVKHCTHPNMRMSKGICPDCYQPVGYK